MPEAMQTSGFTYVRNGITYGYPFIASLNSLLPVVDELVVVVGDSHDGTREAIENLKEPKLKIIDSVWDESLRNNGRIFAQQAALGLNNITGEWAVHLQVDEVLEEGAAAKIKEAIRQADSNNKIDGLLFPFLHFWGDYNHIRNTRRTHRYEIRAFKNTGNVGPYHDSQGFRKYAGSEKGKKLRVIRADTPIFHYSYTRPPGLMTTKANYFHRFWHDNAWLQKNTNASEFDYNDVDRLEVFTGSHPVFMHEVIKKKDWYFLYDPSKSNMTLKDRMLYRFEKATGIRPFEYRNYKLVKTKR